MDPNRPSSDREGGEASDPTRPMSPAWPERDVPPASTEPTAPSAGSWQSTPSTPAWQQPSTPSEPSASPGWGAPSGSGPSQPPAWQSSPTPPGQMPPGQAPPAWQSTPTPASSQTPPAWQSTPSAPAGWQSSATPPGWQQAGAAGWGAAPVPTERPTEVTVAAIILFILGALALLTGVGIMLLGAAVGSFSDQIPGFEAGMEGAMAAGFAIMGSIPLLYGIGEIIAGIGAMRGRDWGRILGLILAIIALLFWILLTLASVGNLGEGGGGSLVFSLVFLAAYGFVVWALAARWRTWSGRPG